MLDFLKISTKYTKTGGFEIYPKFIVKKTKDLMVRGSAFYAIWDEASNSWSTDDIRAIELIDQELDNYKREHPELLTANVMYLWDSENKYIDKWLHYVQVAMPDCYTPLDERLIFSNQETKRDDYSTKHLSYPLIDGKHEAWDELVGTLYLEDERHKIEWCIGAIVSGDSKNIQKFLVFYGSAGTGKSTIINVIQKLFQGYYAVFDAKALGSANAAFALEPLKGNPLVAIQHDGDLSHIEDNTRLNSLVSHELMTVNEKFKSAYANRFNAFLILGTNRPVKITDAKSGILRRLIDVEPSGQKIKKTRYDELMKMIDFELSGIATHCLEVYRENPNAYDNYVPLRMMGASNDFYNFVLDSYEVFKKIDGTSLREAWERYKIFCNDANVPYPLTQMRFKEELKNYFDDFKERSYESTTGTRRWNIYSGFRTEKFDIFEEKEDGADSRNEGNQGEPDPVEGQGEKTGIIFQAQGSAFDAAFHDSQAQYATPDEKPFTAWDNVKTVLSDIDTSRLHYVRPPESLVVIDFDLRGPDGNKSYEMNLEAASKWPPTYAELSKSGAGIHLHYFYTGDVTRLSKLVDENIEIKIFTGKSSLRRKLTLCNDLPIASISSGLPIKEGGKMLSSHVIKSERGIRSLVERNLGKEIHPYTKPSIDFIYAILEDAYTNGVRYDIRDLRPAVMAFAAESTNNASYCLAKVTDMKFCSDEPSQNVEFSNDAPIVIFDVEVFPNLLVVCWKTLDGKVNRWINPTQAQIEDLCLHGKYRLVGFNNRGYDNHILYAVIMGYTTRQVYELSKRIISNSKNGTFNEALNMSYTDIYDFSSEKKSLKKFEIEYGIHHQELGLDWDKEVPEEMWNLVAEYCENDVVATQVVWEKRQGDFIAREILADLTGLTVNHTTNQLTGALIFGKNSNPQCEFVYINLGGEPDCKVEHISQVQSPVTGKWYTVDPVYTCKDLSTGQMMFPGYSFSFEKLKEDDDGESKLQPVSLYRDIKVGEGGYVLANFGMYGRTVTKDVTSMHPHSAIALGIFGKRYTKIFEELVQARVAIKHGIKSGDFSPVAKLFDGKLMKYLTDAKKAKMLVNALKIAINSVYGLTSAKFPNLFKDNRNVDNIIAKRGALFMVNLVHEVEARGGKVVHVKTDSIKVENLTPETEDFINAYGALYGYSFETEHIFDRICLVNKAVYVGKLADDDPDEPGAWEATGKQFAVPYVFKSLFSHEPIELYDMMETFNVQTALYLDMNEGLPDVSELEKQLTVAKKGKDIDAKKILELEAEVAKGHKYEFIGKTGAFCPIKEGRGGGWLVRKNEHTNGFDSATGAKGFRWLEAEVVSNLHKEDDVNRDYYNKLVDAAVKVISKYGDFAKFTDSIM